ncbi:MAG TPA: hypothetical protein VFN22_12440 [Gemmatimonadales bacterium]|nr:hypothetical protein [Gemmatimonadales bacterium]
MSRQIAVAVALALTACQATSSITPHPLVIPGSRELAIGESVDITGAPYLLRLDAVDSDSRCPPDVTCVWAGEVVVRATLAAKSGLGLPDQLITLHGERPVVVSGLSVRITAVSPDQLPSGQVIPEHDYRFTIALERAP